MDKIGLFFGTDSGTTRLVGKKIAKRLGNELVDKPLNINRVTVDDLLAYEVLILGTPTYGEGELPGTDQNPDAPSWGDVVSQLEAADFTGKTVALFGLGDQDGYGMYFVNGMGKLYDLLKGAGATIVGEWSTDGYTFIDSEAIVDDHFVGLAIDNVSQPEMTDERLAAWTDAVKPALEAALSASAQVG